MADDLIVLPFEGIRPGLDRRLSTTRHRRCPASDHVERRDRKTQARRLYSIDSAKLKQRRAGAVNLPVGVLPKQSGPQEQRKYELSNGESRQRSFLRGVNQQGSFGFASEDHGGPGVASWLPSEIKAVWERKDTGEVVDSMRLARIWFIPTSCSKGHAGSAARATAGAGTNRCASAGRRASPPLRAARSLNS